MVDQVTIETTSPALSCEAAARPASRWTSMGLPSIEHEVSSTQVRFRLARFSEVTSGAATPICSA